MVVPKPRKLPSGSWFIQLRLDGESVPVTAPTEKECTRMAALIKAEHRAGKRQEKRSGDTLGQIVEKYISSRSNTLSPSTIRGYYAIKRTRFSSVMDKPIRGIRDWQIICNRESKLCSAKTLKNAWYFIVSALKYAGIEVPNVRIAQVEQKEKPYFEPEQIPLFIKAIKGKSWEVGALLALHGLRNSEIHGLQREDIDIANERIFVHSSLVIDKDNKHITKPTNKNKTSHRYVPILIPELKNAIESIEGSGGRLISQHPQTLYKQINKVCKDSGLPEVGVHGLRHSFATLAYHLGVPEKIAMQIGGWADDSTMRKIYTHLAQKDVEKYGSELKEFFINANK